MPQAANLSPKERTIMERQCRACGFWDNFVGCNPPGGSDDAKPVEDCPAFEEMDDATTKFHVVSDESD